MPYNPQTQFNPLIGGGPAIAQEIAAKWKELEQNDAIDAMNQTIADHARAAGYITIEDYSKFKQAGFRQRQGMANAWQMNILQDLKQQESEARALNQRADAAYRIAGANQIMAEQGQPAWRPQAVPLLDPSGQPYLDPATQQPVMGMTTSPRSAVPLTPRGGASKEKEDTLERLNGDLRTLSGGSLVDWRAAAQAGKVRTEGEEVVGEVPRFNSFGQQVGTRELRIPKEQYHSAQVRYNKLLGIPEAEINMPAAAGSVAAPQAGGAPDLRALAQKALDDPNASEAHKAAARKLLGGK